MQSLFLFLRIPHKGDEGQPQTAATADIMLTLPLAAGLSDTHVEVLQLPLELGPPHSRRHKQHRGQHAGNYDNPNFAPKSLQNLQYINTTVFLGNWGLIFYFLQQLVLF